MDKKNFIKKWINWVSYSQREKLEKEMMNDLNKLTENLNQNIKNEKSSTEIVRYFFVTTIGFHPNNSYAFNTFDIQTTYGYPTIKRCIELSNEKFKNLRNVSLISISEIPAEEWKQFTSKQ